MPFPPVVPGLQEQYVQLQGLYQQLKNQKIQDLEGLLDEQVTDGEGPSPVVS